MEKKARHEFNAPAGCFGCPLSYSEKNTNDELENNCMIIMPAVTKYRESRHPDCPLEIAPETPEGEMKPCPFCGGMAKVEEWLRCYKVKCSVCNMLSGGYGAKNIAIDAWNRREGQ